MTTIAYHHETKTIAYDSRMTMNGAVVTDEFNKMFTIGKYTFFLCGDSLSDINKAVAAFPDTVEIKGNPYGLLVDDGQVFWVSWDNGEPSTFPVNYNITAGSGEMYAIAAMDCGLGAVDAVKIAIGRDIYSGGKIKVFKL